MESARSDTHRPSEPALGTFIAKSIVCLFYSSNDQQRNLQSVLFAGTVSSRQSPNRANRCQIAAGNPAIKLRAAGHRTAANVAFIHFRPSIGIHRKALRLPRERLLLLSPPRKTAHRRNPLVETPIPKQSRRFGSFPLIPLSVVDTPYLLQHPVWPVEHLHSSETPNKRTQNHFAVRIEKVSFSKCCAVATG